MLNTERKARHKALQRLSDERQHIPRIPKWSTSMSTEESDDGKTLTSSLIEKAFIPSSSSFFVAMLRNGFGGIGPI